MIFPKDDNGKYNPRFIEQVTKESVEIDFPLTIIKKKQNPVRAKNAE